ncbi:MAG: nucleoside phosphorylase [Desulfobacteraceae bacterium]|jgi:uridine phosphorylase|nr:nucleoside phosphorylase [Desulfobacteraceae bacterium]
MNMRCRLFVQPETRRRRLYRRGNRARRKVERVATVPETGVVRPVLGRNHPGLGPTVVLISSESDLRAMIDERAPGETDSGRRLFISRMYAGLGVENSTVIGPVVGASYAAMLLETVVAWGAVRVLYFGWCGAVSESVSIGDILVPTKAWIDEGTSLHYGRFSGDACPPSKSLSQKLCRWILEEEGNCLQMPVWSTDGIYRETPRKIRHFSSRGAAAVEMECSALFTVGRFLGVEVAAVLVVSDELHGCEWRPGFRDERFRSSRRKVQAVMSNLCGLESVS